MKVSPARRAAFEIIRRVEEDGAYSSALLAAADEELGAKDRALCHELVLGVLRQRLWLDRALEHFGSRKIERLDLPVALALRLGLYQLRFLSRVPDSAAVNESVNLVRGSRLKSAANFVNAVLRRATRESDYDPAATIADEIEKLAIQTSHPRWLIERWSAQFGFEETAALAEADNAPAPLAFRFTAKATVEAANSPAKIVIVNELQAAGAELVESQIVPNAWRVLRSAPLLRDLARDGLIYFQDEASQLIAHLLGARKGDRVLDVCGAPGSKSTLIAALAPQALIVSGDIYEQRARTIKAFARQQDAGNVLVIQHDATIELPFDRGSFDRVLVDAPCSGTGTLRHNPEIRWRLTASDISELAAKQKLILHNAAAMVSPGGRLLYSTCSVEEDENETVVDDFLRNHHEFARTALDVPKQLTTADGAARTWPHRDDVDGFFVTALERKP